MTIHLALAVGVAVWALVFLFLLVALAAQADVERRWDEAWALDWEDRHAGASIDGLIERLGGQAAHWRLGRRLLSLYVLAGAAAIGALALFQALRSPMKPPEFEEALLYGLALVGFLLLPARVAAEIGLGLLETMHRQARRASGERLVIDFKEEIGRVPKPVKEKPHKAEPAPK